MRALLLSALLAAQVRAGVSVSSIAFEVSYETKKGRAVFHPMESLLLPPDAKPPTHLRAVLTLDNDGPRAESGVVVRFAFSARIRRVSDEGEGTWTVPFLLEERHVPQVARGRGVALPIPINRVALVAHLKRLRTAGYWPDGLKIEMLIEPRLGEGMAGRTAQKTVAVDWRPPPARPGGPTR